MPEVPSTEELTTEQPSLTADIKSTQPIMAVFNKNKKSGSKKTVTIDIFRLIKYIYPMTIFIIILILIWVMYFLYNNVYLTMTQAQIVSTLKTKVIEESVNYNGFNAIADKIKAKEKLSDWPYLNYLASPFLYGKKTPYPANPALATSTPPIVAASTTLSASTSSITAIKN